MSHTEHWGSEPRIKKCGKQIATGLLFLTGWGLVISSFFLVFDLPIALAATGLSLWVMGIWINWAKS